VRQRLQKLLQDAGSAIRTPTLKQKEAYGRFCHTLSAASLIASVSVMFTETKANPDVMLKIGALGFWGVLLFWVGAVLSKGE
jgi:hypothetical protein